MVNPPDGKRRALCRKGDQLLRDRLAHDPKHAHAASSAMGCLGMIRTISAANRTPLDNDDIETCQRVFDYVCVVKAISGREA